MMKTLKVGNLEVPPGSREKGRLGTFYREDGAPVHIPLIVINGTEDGPTLWLSSGMHGQELSGVGVIWELVKERIDPSKLHGAIIAVPFMNPFSFTGGTYFTPQDGLNLHNSFPGDPEGSLTERLANLVYEQGIKKADVVVDLHCNPENAMMFTYAFDPDDEGVGKQGYELAKAFGLTTVDDAPKAEGMSADIQDVAYHLGKPSFLVELTPYYSISPQAVAVGVRGVLNVMKTLKMIEGDVEPQDEVLVIEDRLGIVFGTSGSGGLVIPETVLGDPVTKGQVVGHVVDFFGDPVEEIVSPVDGWMLTWPYLNQSVFSGDLVTMYVYPKG
jgi:predicted deacylase